MGSSRDDESLLARLNALKPSTIDLDRTPASVTRRLGTNANDGDGDAGEAGDDDVETDDDDLARRFLGLRTKDSTTTDNQDPGADGAQPEIDQVESLEDMMRELRAGQRSALAPGDDKRAQILLAQANATLGEDGDQGDKDDDGGGAGGVEGEEGGSKDGEDSDGKAAGRRKGRVGSSSSSNKDQGEVADGLARLKAQFAKYSKSHGESHVQDGGKEDSDGEAGSEDDDAEADAILAELLDDVQLTGFEEEQEEQKQAPEAVEENSTVPSNSRTQQPITGPTKQLHKGLSPSSNSSEPGDLVLPSAPTISHPEPESDDLVLPAAPTGNFTKPVPKSSLRKYTDAEIETWCEICQADSQVKCLGCDGDLYCMRCWKEGHTGPDAGFEERMHKCVQYSKPGGAEAAAA